MPMIRGKASGAPKRDRRAVAGPPPGERLRWRFVLAGVALTILSGGCASVRPCGDLDLGCVISKDRTHDGTERCRVAGPVFEHQTTDSGSTFTAVRPFYAVTSDVQRERRLQEILWPIGTVKRLGQETHWRFLTAYGHDFDNRIPDSRHRGMVFPFVFWGRDMEGEKYFSLFPLGGTLHEFLGCDRIFYALFPLYAQSVSGDQRSRHILWPICTYSRSEDLFRFRIFPFYGRSVDEGEYTKQFVLWPLWTHARYDEPGHSGSSTILFPIYGRTRTEDQQGWMVLPPLFRWSKSEERTELNAPWPFIQYASGDYEKLYIWPLWGRRENDGIISSFWLWPFIRAYHAERAQEKLDRFLLLPFIYHERVVAKDTADHGAEGGPEVRSRYFKLWPLVSYQREKDTSRVRFLELWPLKHTGPIERNMAPFWTLYTRTQTDQVLDHELLWGLFRYRRDEAGPNRLSLFPLFSRSRCGGEDGSNEARQWSLLLGLLGHEEAAQQSTWRLLWFLKLRSKIDRPQLFVEDNPDDHT